LDDKPKSRPSNGTRQPPSRSNTSNGPSRSSRGENIPPRGPQLGHRPTRSQEEALRARRVAGSSSRTTRPSGELDIFADPAPQKHRVRRNSESSVSSRSLDPEEEKKRQERRRRERRHREQGKEGRPKKTDRKLDIIDKLDVTSIYGTGRKFFSLSVAFFLTHMISFPPRWTIRCVQPSSQSRIEQTCPNASFPQGFTQQCLRRRWTFE